MLRVTDIAETDLVRHQSGDTVHRGRDPDRADPHAGPLPGYQCFFVDGCLVSGDTLFLEGCGRTDLPGGDPAALYESLTTEARQGPGRRRSSSQATSTPQSPRQAMGDTRHWS